MRSLLLVAVLLAGCAGSPHAGHGSGDTGLLLGFSNATNETLAVSWSLVQTRDNATVWQGNATLAPDQLIERFHETTLTSDLEIRVEYRVGDAGTSSFRGPAVPGGCQGVHHAVFAIRGVGDHGETTRECH